MRTPKPFYRRFNDAWYVELNGRQFRLAKGKANEAEALRRYFELMAQQPLGALPEPLPNPNVAAVCDLFLDWAERHTAPRTFAFYRKFLQDFCSHVGRLPVRDLVPYHATKWLDLHPKWKGSRRCAVISIKRAFAWAQAEGLLKENPLRSLKKPPVSRRERALTHAERAAIFASYPSWDPFRDFLVALQESGARPGEVAAVTAADLDLDEGVWLLRQHKTAGKTGRPRVIILTPTLLELSRKLAAKYRSGPLFRNRIGRPWVPGAIQLRFRRIREKLGLGDDVVAYLYRHSFCTDALVNGVGIAQVAELLGHVNADMVMKHYQHLKDQRGHLRTAAITATRPLAS